MSLNQIVLFLCNSDLAENRPDLVLGYIQQISILVDKVFEFFNDLKI